ncbi:MAG: molybdate ABC transporter substrate-binding protein [Alphaproteobacteria bacterium]|nr:molybdate ABC transporter substrate-binding protein [Alphaproteobacteria bacterium]
MLRRILLAASLVLATGTAQAEDLLVFAAASLKGPLDEAAAAFGAREHVSIAISFGASSALARQIEAGAEADLFLSADEAWMDYLAERSLIAPETRRVLFGNALVLIAPKASTIALTLSPHTDLKAALAGGYLAVADPAGVPAGKYAKAALSALGLWDGIAGQTARADNVRAALAFVARGEAPLGIVYATDAKAEPDVRVVAAFEGSLHPPIVYPGAVTSGSDHGQAGALLDYLASVEGFAAFERAGFTPVP